MQKTTMGCPRLLFMHSRISLSGVIAIPAFMCSSRIAGWSFSVCTMYRRDGVRHSYRRCFSRTGVRTRRTFIQSARSRPSCSVRTADRPINCPGMARLIRVRRTSTLTPRDLSPRICTSSATIHVSSRLLGIPVPHNRPRNFSYVAISRLPPRGSSIGVPSALICRSPVASTIASPAPSNRGASRTLLNSSSFWLARTRCVTR